jgi:parallel beta-helix repeat protein
MSRRSDGRHLLRNGSTWLRGVLIGLVIGGGSWSLSWLLGSQEPTADLGTWPDEARSRVVTLVPGPSDPETTLAATVTTVASQEESGPTTPGGSRCDVLITLEMERIDEQLDILPGSVLCFEPGVRRPLEISNVHGEPGNPVVIMAIGPVEIEGTFSDYAGIDITRSTHLWISGKEAGPACGAGFGESDQACGIRIRGTGRGIAGTEGSSFIEIDHVEITETSHSGIFLRAKADEGTRRAEFTQRNTSVRSVYIHRVGKEGMYIGSSDYVDRIDPELSGVTVVSNLVVETGWDGIQVGSAVEDCVIEANVVLTAGTTNTTNQNSGIMNNWGSVCDIVGNLVFESAAHGIYVQGNGGNRIFNNIIIGPGAADPGRGDAVVISTGSADHRSVSVWHNTIVAARRYGLRFRYRVGDANEIVNNLVVGGDPELAIDTNGLDVVLAGNVVVSASDSGLFGLDTLELDLTRSSPAVDAGSPVTDPLMMRDFLGNERPSGPAPDAGAIELVTEASSP